MSVSLCMIVKNEQDNLAKCLGSVRDFVDEIILVDTGSTDETIKIAKSFGAKIYHYKWSDSFAEARNYSLSKANKQWILIMDADDVFERDDKEKLLSITENKIQGSNIYCCKTLCYTGNTPDDNSVLSNMNIRLIKNKMGYKYQGRIHEQIVLREEDKNIPYPIVATDIRFHHYGYLTSHITEKDKHKRNINLIQKELDENPDNAFMLFNMGNEYFALQDIEKALVFYKNSLQHSVPGQGFFPVLLIRIIMCDDALHNDSELFEFVKLGLLHYPAFTDFEFLKGNALLRQNRIAEALHSFKKCIKMGTPPANINSIVGVATFKPHYAISSIYVKLGDFNKALTHCVKAIKYYPSFRFALAELADLLARKGRTPNTIKNRLTAMVPHDAGSFLMLSDIFYDRKYYKQAYALAVQAEQLGLDAPITWYYKGMCKFYLKKYKQAYTCLLKASTGVYRSKAAFVCALCTSFDDKIPRTAHIDFQSRMDAPYYQTFLAYCTLLNGKECGTLAEDTAASQPYLKPMFDILEILLRTSHLEYFRKALQLLNLITNDEVLLLLGKTYYKNGYAKLAYDELIRSIKLTGKIDAEGLTILRNTIAAANS